MELIVADLWERYGLAISVIKNVLTYVFPLSYCWASWETTSFNALVLQLYPARCLQPANRDGARSSAVPKRSSQFWNWSASSGSVNLADFSGRVTWEIRVCLFFICNELKTWFTSQGLWGNFWKQGKLSFWMCLYLFLCMYKVHIHIIFHIYVSYIY